MKRTYKTILLLLLLRYKMTLYFSKLAEKQV